MAAEGRARSSERELLRLPKPRLRIAATRRSEG